MSDLLQNLYQNSVAIRKDWVTGTIIFELKDISYMLSGQTLVRVAK